MGDKNNDQSNFQALNEELLQINLDNEVFISENITEMYSNFVSILNNCIDKHIH